MGPEKVRTRRKRKNTEKLETVYLLKLLARTYIWVRKSGKVKLIYGQESQLHNRERVFLESTRKLHPLPPKEYTPSSERSEEWVVCYGVGKETKEALV